MARRNKLLKFTEILTFPNVYENVDPSTDILIGENGTESRLKGRWREDHFENSNPLVLELACGRGEYSLELSRRYPERNFVGVDIKGARIWKGAQIALKEKLDNAAFLRTRIEMIDNFFDAGEVDEIWITFPDPFLKKSKRNRRLTAPGFLQRYRLFLKPDGIINLKTDSTTLYDYTLEVLHAEGCEIIRESDDIYSMDLIHPDLDIQTYYEKQHLAKGKKIKFVRFRLPA